MEVLIRSFFGSGSGVVEDIIGKEHNTYVFDQDDTLHIISAILGAFSDGDDIQVMYLEE